jgi:hypothetical protein
VYARGRLGTGCADGRPRGQILRRDLVALARIIAGNSTAALPFDDPQAAADTLASLRERTRVIGACMYRPDSTIFATYSRQGAMACPVPGSRDEVRFSAEQVIVSQSIVQTGSRMGTLMLASKLRKVIATPVSRLVDATTSVSETAITARARRNFRAMNWASWSIDLTRCWPASSRGKTT